MNKYLFDGLLTLLGAPAIASSAVHVRVGGGYYPPPPPRYYYRY